MLFLSFQYCWSFFLRSSLLPGLLDEKGPLEVGLLHWRPHPTVSHTHRGLWEAVTQLQKELDESLLSKGQASVANPVCLVAGKNVPSASGFNEKLTLSRVPPRRMPTCCILVKVPRDLLQVLKKSETFQSIIECTFLIRYIIPWCLITEPCC